MDRDSDLCSQMDYLFVDNLNIRPSIFYPRGDLGQDPVHMSVIIADYYASDGGQLVVVILGDFSSRDVEVLVQASKQWF